ncbi:hypothetical protein DFR31_1605 [Alkalispirillum mobile]|uniref:PqqD family protein of HPr-rel-A system n=1 Tax=Alkalispirillum mobile TaxID=85925 RepID=A0A498CE96_9GAMM|nr:hypothetical protein [Alkalispirillum mobile]RLK51660.1 hypothetical protein DFR31_1605 [Alkalispirillum mobile]
MQDAVRLQDWALAPETEYRFCDDLVLAFHAGTGDTLVLAGAGAELLTLLDRPSADHPDTPEPALPAPADCQEALEALRDAGLIQPRAQA